MLPPPNKPLPDQRGQTMSNIPIVYNLNVGHATPRAIVPFGVHAHVDAQEQVIRFDYNEK